MSKLGVQRVLPVVLALLLAPAAVAANPPGLAGAQRTCKSQGLTIGSAAYTQCVQNQLGSAPSTNSGATLTNGTSVGRLAQTCLNHGLVPNSEGFLHCLAAAKTQAARKTCTAKGLTQGSSAFARCVKQHLQAGTK